MPRVLHLIGSNFVGGPEKQVLAHAVLARAKGWDVVVSSFRDGPGRAEILCTADSLGLETAEIGCSGHFVPKAVEELRTILREQRIDLLCTHGYKANFIGCFAKKVSGHPQVAFLRGYTAETWRIRAYEVLDRFLLARTENVVCVSRPQAEQVGARRRTGMKAPRVIRNAVHLPLAELPIDRVSLRKRLGLPERALIVGAVGRLSREKGHHILVQAAAEFRKASGGIRVVIFGEGRELEALKRGCQELGVSDIVTFAGFEKQISPWIQACDVIVNPSLTEGTPNVVLEAMALGTPVIATAVGGVPDMIEDQQTGVLVPPSDCPAIAEAVSKLLSQPEKRDEMAKAAQKAISKWSGERQTEQLIDLYCEVLRISPDMDKTAAREAGPVPFLSVVIPVRNERTRLPAVLSDLVAQRYPTERFEIIVADGGSTDGTVDEVEQFRARIALPAIKVLPNPARLASAGRNTGVLHSRGEIVIFIDGHCRIPDTGLLGATAAIFEKTGADCLCRPQPLEVPGRALFQTVVANTRASLLGHGRDSTIFKSDFEGPVDPTSSGACYRRSVLTQLGGYDEQMDACEDVEFNHRVKAAGFKSFFSPRLKVLYEPRSRAAGLWRQMIRYGRGRFRFLRKHPEATTIAQLVPAALIVTICMTLLVAPFSHFVRVAGALIASSWLLLVLASSVVLAWRFGWAHLILSPVVYALIHGGLGAGFCYEALSTPFRIQARRSPALKRPKAAEAAKPKSL